jgi:hypothetical protein
VVVCHLLQHCDADAKLEGQREGTGVVRVGHLVLSLPACRGQSGVRVTDQAWIQCHSSGRKVAEWNHMLHNTMC